MYMWNKNISNFALNGLYNLYEIRTIIKAARADAIRMSTIFSLFFLNVEVLSCIRKCRIYDRLNGEENLPRFYSV